MILRLSVLWAGGFSDTFTRVGQVAEESRPRVEMSFLEIYNENVYDLLGAGDEVREEHRQLAKHMLLLSNLIVVAVLRIVFN